MDSVSETKSCTTCHVVKPVSDFNKKGTKRKGLRGQCKACERAKIVERNKKGFSGLRKTVLHPLSKLTDEIGLIALRGKHGEGKFVKVDPIDYEEMACYGWFAWRSEHGDLYAMCGQVVMHRVIAGSSECAFVDHKNGDTLDNRRENLRPCTPQQNTQNSRARKGSSKYKGVHWRKSHNKWVASIRANEKTLDLGRYSSEIDAARAYDEAAKKYYGDFARLNFP